MGMLISFEEQVALIWFHPVPFCILNVFLPCSLLRHSKHLTTDSPALSFPSSNFNSLVAPLFNVKLSQCNASTVTLLHGRYCRHLLVLLDTCLIKSS